MHGEPGAFKLPFKTYPRYTDYLNTELPWPELEPGYAQRLYLGLTPDGSNLHVSYHVFRKRSGDNFVRPEDTIEWAEYFYGPEGTPIRHSPRQYAPDNPKVLFKLLDVAMSAIVERYDNNHEYA